MQACMRTMTTQCKHLGKLNNWAKDNRHMLLMQLTQN